MKRPSHATVVAYVALFLALGGVGYAALRLPANSVGTRQLKARAVTLGKISRRARAALRGARGAEGPRGLTGAAGPKGAKGSTGPAGPASGSAGGDLTGSYPSPRIANGAVTPAKIGTIPAARVTLGLGSPVASGAATPVPFDTTSFDNDGLYDAGARTLEAPVTGIYQIDGGVEWAPNVTGTRFVGIQIGSSCCDASSLVASAGAATTTRQNVSDLVLLSAGTLVSLTARQDSGAALTVDATNATFLAMHWAGP